MDKTDSHNAAKHKGEASKEPGTATIGIALSGGGFRASLHGLGAMMYLVDAELNKRVTSIVSVSGGSITNAYIAANCNFQEIDRDQFDRLAAQLVRVITRRGLLRTWPVLSYLIFVLILFGFSFAGLFATWIGFWPLALSWTIFIAGSGAAFSLLLLRGHLLSWLLKRLILGNAGHCAANGSDEPQREESNPVKSWFNRFLGRRPEQGNEEVEHGFSATDLNHGAPVFFLSADGGKLYSEALKKWTSFPVFEKLHEVVRASAAFPGGFPPKRLRVSDFRKGGFLSGLFSRQASATLYLADGGVWNNLGTDLWADETTWWSGSGTMSKDAYSRNQRLAAAPELRLVVNSGAPLSLRPSRWLSIPIIAEFVALMRTMESLYQNTVTPRVRQMQIRARMPKSIGAQLSGPPQTVVVDLRNEPVQWVWTVERDHPGTEEEVAQRQNRGWNLLLELLKTLAPEVQNKFHELLEAKKSPGAEKWSVLFDFLIRNLARLITLDATPVGRTVPTTLNKVAARSAAALLTHGYVSTMAGMHVLYGEPMLHVPTAAEIASRVRLDDYHPPLGLGQKSEVIKILNAVSVSKDKNGGISVSYGGVGDSSITSSSG